MSMKILVPIKRVVDFNVKVRVKADGIGRRHRQRQDVDEPVRRDRGRGGGAAEGGGHRDRDRRRVVRRRRACQETLRTALALGADRAILVETDVELQPLAVAKLLKAIVDKEKPQLVDPGQAGDRRRRQPDRADARGAARLAAGDLRIEGRSSTAGVAKVTREVDGGLETVDDELPAVVTTDLRLNEPRYVTLPNIMKAKKKPLETLKPEALGVDVAPRLDDAQGRASRRSARAACKVGRDVDELVDKLRNEAKVI